MREETWDAVAKVATDERVRAVNGSPSNITALIEESVRVALVTELEHIAEDWEAEAEQIKSSPCFNDYDESTVDEIAVRVTALRKHATELKADQR